MRLDVAPIFFLLGDVGMSPTTSHSPTPRQLGLPISPSPFPHSNIPISPHIDEDALEGVYFAFSTILRCLPYFFLKTRPRASYGLLEAFSSSLTTDGASVGKERGDPTTSHRHPTPTPHLTPHRRGCPRRGLFRVFDNPNVFALLFAKNAS